MRAFFALLLGVLFMGSDARPVREYYVTFPMKSNTDIQALVDRGLDVAGINLEDHTVTAVVKETQMRSTEGLRVLRKREIFAPDDEFTDYKKLNSFLADVEKNFPDLVQLDTLGKSVEGRDIPLVKITNRFFAPSQPKKTILFDAMHHAREVMTVEVAIDIIDYLTKNYATDSKVQKWVDNYEIYVIPMMNPDGNNRVWTEENMWRKNTQGGYGVDINRNYTYAWGKCNGSSSSKWSDTYRGSAAGSEPETQAIMNLAKRIKPKFNISYHSYSEIVIYPFGCSPEKIPAHDRTVYEKYGWDLAKKLVRDSGSGTYSPGTSYELLYNVDGGSIDWMYAEAKVMSFVIEVNNDSQGFQPSYSKWRDKTVKGQRPGWQFILDSMEGPGITGPTQN